MKLFTDDAEVEDPVGDPVRVGHDAIAALWDVSRTLADAIQLVPTGPVRVAGTEAAWPMHAITTIGDDKLVVDIIDVMTFDDDADHRAIGLSGTRPRSAPTTADPTLPSTEHPEPPHRPPASNTPLLVGDYPCSSTGSRDKKRGGPRRQAAGEGVQVGSGQSGRVDEGPVPVEPVGLRHGVRSIAVDIAVGDAVELGDRRRGGSRWWCVGGPRARWWSATVARSVQGPSCHWPGCRDRAQDPLRPVAGDQSLAPAHSADRVDDLLGRAHRDEGTRWPPWSRPRRNDPSRGPRRRS